MKYAVMICAGLLAFSAPLAAADPEKDAVKALIKSVKQGEDLTIAYPGAVSARENASLSRVAKCSANGLRKQKGGHYTVLWDCGSKGVLAMTVTLTDGKINMVFTESPIRLPNVGSR